MRNPLYRRIGAVRAARRIIRGPPHEPRLAGITRVDGDRYAGPGCRLLSHLRQGDIPVPAGVLWCHVLVGLRAHDHVYRKEDPECEPVPVGGGRGERCGRVLHDYRRREEQRDCKDPRCPVRHDGRRDGHGQILGDGDVVQLECRHIALHGDRPRTCPGRGRDDLYISRYVRGAVFRDHDLASP